MRLHVKKDELTQKLVAEYLAKGGVITREDAQTATKRMRKSLSLASKHLGKHNKFGARV
jgi:hypothetical protein